jgi:transposase
MATRTMRINSARGLLREFGIVFPVGASTFAGRLEAVIEDADVGIPVVLRDMLHERLIEIRSMEDRIRMLLIHGARAVLQGAQPQSGPGRFRTWAVELQRGRGHKKAAVAVANKLARIVWAVWKSGQPFQLRVDNAA